MYTHICALELYFFSVQASTMDTAVTIKDMAVTIKDMAVTIKDMADTRRATVDTRKNTATDTQRDTRRGKCSCAD